MTKNRETHARKHKNIYTHIVDIHLFNVNETKSDQNLLYNIIVISVRVNKA